MKTTITYSELARRVGDIFLLNNIPELTPDWYESIENYTPMSENEEGELVEDYDNGDYPEIMQWYAITESGYDYLKRNTSEIIGYSGPLDTHYWCITHFGTSWSYVHTTIEE